MNIPQNTTLVYNTLMETFGFAFVIEPSPYVAEEMMGIERVKVWCEIPGAGEQIDYGWDQKRLPK